MDPLLWSCDAFTGEKLALLPMSGASWARLLSAGGDGSVTIPIDDGLSRTDLRDVLEPWRRILVIEIAGVPVFGGYSLGRKYALGGNAVEVSLRDVWAMFGRRGGWDRAHPDTARWSTQVTGTRGVQAWSAVHRGRNTGSVLDKTRFPVTLVSTGGGPSVVRTVFGYHLEMIADILSGLMDEGLDIYMRPRWVDGRFDWGFHAGPAWGSGVTREFAVSVAEPVVSGFSEGVDAGRVTNNAVRIGEGSEVDMLARSRQNFDSTYPVLDRITSSKTSANVAQLDQQALADLDLYGSPTVQWDFNVLATEPVDVGDTVRLLIADDPLIADGWHSRRVVKVSGGLDGFKTVGVQPVGGA